MNPEPSNPMHSNPGLNRERSREQPPAPGSDSGRAPASHPPAQGTRRDAARELTQDAILPERVRVNQTEGTGVEIAWKDGHASHWAFAWLRDACPCAGCVDERGKAGRAPGEPEPPADAALPMFKPAPRPNRVRPIGRYAVAFDWNDGHRTGIYSWYYLRSICQCAECAAARKAAESS